MRRTFRAVRADPMRAWCLLAVVAAMVAGTACVFAYGPRDLADGSAVATVSGMVLAGCLGTATLTLGVLRNRAGDIAIATVRGVSAGRMWRWLCAEPIVVTVAGTAAGLGLAGLGWAWLSAAGRGPADRPGTALLAATGAGICCILTVTACCTAYRSVVRATTPARSTPVWLAAGQYATLAGAAWLLYQAAVSSPGEREMLTAFAPVAAGLAVVVLSGWLSRLVGLAGTLVWSRTTDLGRFVASRRLRRATALAITVASVGGALVVGLFAATAERAESHWRAEAAVVATGGVTAYASDRSASATFLATRTADPDGRWLMAVVGAPGDSEPPDYRGYADLTRWQRVIGTPWDSVADVDTDAVGAEFAADSWRPLTIAGGPVRLRVENRLRWPAGEQAYLNLSLLSRNGDIDSIPVRVRSPRASVLVGRVGGCATACVLRKITIGTRADAPIDVRGSLVLHAIDSGGEGTGWRGGDERRWAPDLQTAAGGSLDVRAAADGLELRADATGLADPVGVVPTESHLERRVLAAGDTDVGDRVLGLDSVLASAAVVDRYPILPVLGTHGYLGNLPDVVLDSFDEPVGSRVRVLARDDTPAGVLESLAQAGVGVDRPLTSDDVTTELAGSDDSRGALAWVLLALVAAIVGIAVAAHSEASARSRVRHDSASLRAVQVPRRAVVRALSYEIALVSSAAAVPAAGVGLATWWCVRDALVLADPAPFQPRVDLSVPWVPFVLAVTLAFAVSGTCVLALRRHDAARARPEILRHAEVGE